MAVLSAIRGQTVDRRHFDGHLDHGFVPQPDHRVDYTSVRRYNVDFCPIYSSPEGIVQPGGSNLKLYVVSRRNSLPGFQSYLPFDVFTQLNHSNGGQEQSPGGQRDIFDFGISSSDDGTEFGGSPYLTPKSVGKRLDSTRSSIQRDIVSPHVQYTPVASVSATSGFHEGTGDGPNVGVSSTVVPEVVVSSGNSITAPQQGRKKTISGRHAIEHLSPTGYSPFASFGNIYANGLKEQTGADIPAAPDVNIAKPEVLKKRRGRKPKDAAKRGRKKHVSLVPDMVPIDSEPLPLRIADASVLDTSTDHIHSPVTKAVPHVSTAMMPLPTAVGDTTSIHRIYDHVDMRRLSNGNVSLDIGGHTGAESIDNRSDANVQTNAIDAGRLSLAVGSDAIDMGEYATLEDHVRRGSLGGPNKRPRQRVAKDSISSAMLLNSWYISYVNKGDKKRARRAAVEDAMVSDDRPRRYPTRNRLPPIQHWNSNFHEDGSSVLFLVGVTSSDDAKLNQSLAPSDLLSDDGNSPVGSPVASRMQPRKIPDASLVLSDSGGTMDVHLVESSAERHLPITNHASGRDDIAILPLNSRDGRTREPRSDIDLRAIEDVRTGTSIPKSVRKPAKRVEGTRKSTAGRKKERREMTVGEAWDILLTEDHVTSDDVSEIQERPKVAKRGRPKASTVSTASLTMTEKGPTQSASQPRGNLEPDSEAFDRGRLFSYNSLFRIDRAPIHAHHGSLFQPLVMNKRCRTSHVVIPKGKNVQMGNVKGNFITGYLYTGDRVCIRSLGTHWPVEPGRAFFLPIYEEWALYNESETHDAVLALIFVTIQ